jgi:hypothetical protein
VTIDELLQVNRIRLKSAAPGRHYTTCPQCSAKRSKAHQGLKVLGVTIDTNGARWGCSHCGWTGPSKGSGTNGRADDNLVTYDYLDENGTLLFQKVRAYPKKFWQRRPDGAGGWINNLGNTRKVLYRLPEVNEAIAADNTVVCVEGEKDADNLWKIGVPATCNPDGAAKSGQQTKWRTEYSEILRDVDVVIIGDNDDAGRAHVEATASMLVGIATQVRVLDLAKHWPDCPLKGGDISDWLDAGHTREKLDALIEAKAKPWKAPATAVVTEEFSGHTHHRPVVKLVGGELPRIVDEAESALLRSGRDFYRFGGAMVRPVVEKVPAADMRRTQVHRLMPVPRAHLVEVLTDTANFQRFDRREKEWKDVDCPKDVADTYLARVGEWKLRPLVGVVNAPLLRADGSLLKDPGYDERTGLLFRPDETEFGRIPECPTKEDASRALALLDELIATFPFVTEADRSVALSAILSALDRRSVPTTPMHAFDAPIAGSGKSLLVDICSMIATGRAAPVIEQSKDEKELDKRLAASLLRGGAIISIDNVERPLESSLLCQALTTSGLMEIRLFGELKHSDVPNTAMIYCTGNNLVLYGDLTRRSIRCRLDPNCERPELREFRTAPLDMARNNRAEYVMAGLTVLRGYMIAKDRIEVAPLASYGEWSRRVREALMWLDRADPCETMISIRGDDPVTGNLSAVIAEWRDAIGVDKPVNTQALISMANRVDLGGGPAYPGLRDALHAIAPDGREINSRRLGKWILRNLNRVIDGFKLVKNGEAHHVAVWMLRGV